MRTSIQRTWLLASFLTLLSGLCSAELGTGPLFGDVRVCSGQSSMEWAVADAMTGPVEIALADDTRIRHFEVPRSWAPDPMARLAGGVWEPAAPFRPDSW